tara:strand:+ start:171 stop:800 length:630 start_codon:yes stop_codon:yes gene_type:complete
MNFLKSDTIKFLVVIVVAAILFFILYRLLHNKNQVNESFISNLPQEEYTPSGDTHTLDATGNDTTATGDMTNNLSSNQMVPDPQQGLGQNEVFKPYENGNDSDPLQLNDNQLPKDCYPKDQLTPSELLPGDANSKWSQVNPSGQGDLADQNFLNAGYHLGVNTVGQTLRNANLQLRSEPPNPQVKVSPWLQTTIEPDTNRKPMEIGGCE